MRVLIATQYYRPESGATQNRMAAFADGLTARGHSVTVVCEQPNHPAGVFQPGYGRRPLQTERAGGQTTHRVWVYTRPAKTLVSRIAFYATFGLGAAATMLCLRRHDVVLATTPPLPGALAAAAAAQVRRTPLVVDVRDPWPAAAEALGELSNARVIRMLERAEAWLYRRAGAVTATTRPFVEHVDRVARRRIAQHIPNGALDALVERPASPQPQNPEFTVGYVGNLGIAQGLGIVLDAAEDLAGEPVRFLLVGDGPLSAELREQAQARGLSNVTFGEAVPVAEVGEILASCDALLIPLRAHPVFADFVPSKLYDAMAMARPVIVAASGESAQIVHDSGCGLVVAPEDGPGLAAAVRELAGDPHLRKRLAAAGRAAGLDFARSRQIDRLEQILIAAAKAGD